MLTKEDPKTREIREKTRNNSQDLPIKKMKPSLVADEMFPEGAGPYMDIEEVQFTFLSNNFDSFFYYRSFVTR